VKAVAIVLGLLLVPLDAGAKCAPSGLRAAVATPPGTAIPDGGGIVVVADAFFDDGNTATGDVAVQKAGDKIAVFWVDAMGRKSPASKRVAIAGKKVDVDE
jgi:hypothetical protein